MKKRVIYVDMDGVVADFDGGFKKLSKEEFLKGDEATAEYRNKMVDKVCEENPDIFHNLEPIPGAIEGVKKLMEYYEVYFLSTPMYGVPKSYMDKRLWLEKHFGELAKKKLILSHNKGLCKGEFLIDDRIKNGVEDFEGEHIHFGQEDFPTWYEVLKKLIPENNGLRIVKKLFYGLNSSIKDKKLSITYTLKNIEDFIETYEVKISNGQKELSYLIKTDELAECTVTYIEQNGHWSMVNSISIMKILFLDSFKLN